MNSVKPLSEANTRQHSGWALTAHSRPDSPCACVACYGGQRVTNDSSPGATRGAYAQMDMVAVLGLASIVFLSVVLIVAALMMRNQWDRLGPPRRPPSE